MTSPWSDSLIEKTRKALNDGLIGRDSFVHLKNSQCKFGKIHLNDALVGNWLIQDKMAATQYQYSSCDELIEAGWVVD